MNIIPAQVGATLDDVDTPAPIVDLDAFEHNVRTMATFDRSAGLSGSPQLEEAA